MGKVKIGDIFEINTGVGLAYLHYIHKDDVLGELIRILPRVNNDRPTSLEEFIHVEESFMVFFPLSAAYRQKIVERVGYFTANHFEKPKNMRTKHIIRGEFLGWHIIDTETWKRELVKTLTPEQKKFSPWGVWNDTLLIENLASGWTLENWS